MPQQGYDLGADALHRIERGLRVLRNQRDAAAEQVAPFRLRHRNEIASLELNGATTDDGILRRHAEHGTPQHRLSGAGFSYQPPYLPGPACQAVASYHV